MRDIVENPEAWSAVAADYDETVRQKLGFFSAAAVDWLGLAEDDVVLDVACGPGTTTELVAPRVRRVHAVDFAPRMIEMLRANLRDRDNVTTEVGDGQKLTLHDETFTVAVSMFGLMFFADTRAGLRELHRVLRPGGRALISSWVPMAQSPMMKPLGEALMTAIGPRPDAEPPAPFAFEDEGQLVAGLTEAGFVDVQVRRVAPELEVGSADAYWADTRGNVVVRHMQQMAGSHWPTIEAKALAHLRATLEGVQTLEMPGLLALGRKPA